MDPGPDDPAHDAGLPEAEASDDGASSSQFELVEEEGGSEDAAQTHGTANTLPADNTKAGTTTTGSAAAPSTGHSQQWQPGQATQQSEHVPSSTSAGPQQAASGSPSSIAAAGSTEPDRAGAPAADERPTTIADNTQSQDSPEPTDAEFRQLEERAKQVAQGVQDMASSVSKSLFSALGSATDATSNIGHLSLGNNIGKLSSWWSNLDATMAANSAPAAPEPSSSSRAPAAAAVGAAGGSAALDGTVELDAGENLVESFACKLVQTYACSHNNCTPAIQMTFAGRLFITDRHAHFIIDERGDRAPIKLRLSDVATATRERGTHRGDAPDVLKITVRAPGHAADAAGASSSGAATRAGAATGTGAHGSSGSTAGLFGSLPLALGGAVPGISAGSSAGSSGGGLIGAGAAGSGGGGGGGGYWVAFKDFEGAAGLDNALALVEHLREGA